MLKAAMTLETIFIKPNRKLRAEATFRNLLDLFSNPETSRPTFDAPFQRKIADRLQKAIVDLTLTKAPDRLLLRPKGRRHPYEISIFSNRVTFTFNTLTEDANNRILADGATTHLILLTEFGLIGYDGHLILTRDRTLEPEEETAYPSLPAVQESASVRNARRSAETASNTLVDTILKVAIAIAIIWFAKRFLG